MTFNVRLSYLSQYVDYNHNFLEISEDCLKLGEVVLYYIISVFYSSTLQGHTTGWHVMSALTGISKLMIQKELEVEEFVDSQIALMMNIISLDDSKIFDDIVDQYFRTNIMIDEEHYKLVPDVYEKILDTELNVVPDLVHQTQFLTTTSNTSEDYDLADYSDELTVPIIDIILDGMDENTSKNRCSVEPPVFESDHTTRHQSM